MLHWKRSCWVIHMWKQVDLNHMNLEPITLYGWAIQDSRLTIQWDTEENLKAIRERVTTLTRGCKCVSGCRTKRCGCVKKNRLCSVGCECTHCINTLPRTSPTTPINTDLPSHDSDVSDDDLDDIMTSDFGGDNSYDTDLNIL